MDWMPTIAKWCGGEIDHKIDGKDISGVIASSSGEGVHDVLHWERPGRNKHWAVREGKWKLVANAPPTKDRHLDLPGAKFFLSNMEVDVTETKNLAREHPDVVKRLTKLHDEWSAEVVTQ